MDITKWLLVALIAAYLVGIAWLIYHVIVKGWDWLVKEAPDA